MAIALHKSTDNRVIEAATTALLARMTGLPANRDLLINQTIWELVKTGIWEELDEIVLYAIHNEEAAMLAWKNAYNPTFVDLLDKPTFVADRGFTGGSGNKQINTNFNPTTAISPKYTQNSASFGFGSRTDNNNVGFDFGTTVANPAWGRAYGSVNNAQHVVNHSTTQSYSNNGSSIGRFHSRRTGSTSLRGFKNGDEVIGGNQGTATTGLPNATFWSLGDNNGGSSTSRSTRQNSYYFIGSGNIDPKVIDNIISGYLRAIGAL